jgi:hypothetical protein
VALLSLAFAGSAGAKVVNLYTYNGTYPTGSFTGSDAVGAGAFGEPANVEINQASGDVYVGSGGYIYHLNSAGVSQPFTSVTPNTVISQGTYGLGALKLDNSGTSTNGRIFAKEEYSDLYGFLPSGAPIGEQFPIQGLGDGCGADVAPDGGIWVANYGQSRINRYNTSGVSSEEFISTPFPCGFAIDSQENFYVPGYAGSTIKKYNRAGELLDEEWGGSGMGGENIAIDRSNDNVFVALGDHVNEFDSSGAFIGSFGFAEGSKSYPGISGAEGIAVNFVTHKVYVGDTYGSHRVDTFVQTGPITIPNVTTEGANVTPTTATLHGTVDPDAANGGTEITGCRFEWGTSTSYNHVEPCDQATPINSPTAVTVTVAGLTTGTTYHYRLAANNSNNVQSNGADKTFEPAGPPIISNEAVSDVNTDGATISGKINPAGGFTQYHIEYGTTTAYGSSQPVPEAELPNNLGTQSFAVTLSGLSAGTTYHYRVVATNLNGTVNGTDHVFSTFPGNSNEIDQCANAQVRQQTGASQLLDCRAYELASAASTGGYDVQSTLIPGLVTLPPEPDASDRVLYSVHFGSIPGTGEPTNFGLDPYVATRGGSSWSTEYVGIPAGGTPSVEPFGSPLAGSSAGLTAFAFAGPELCDPCFSDGSRGIPVRLTDGSLVQGMQGSLDPGPGAEPAGLVAKSLSDDGSHLVFGSTAKFEPAATGTLTIYDRNLSAGSTQVVSTLPSGTAMSGSPAELDISANGGRILIGLPVSTDSAGNTYYDLYMHIGSSPNSVVVADTASGVLFDGMTGDGTKVFFTTADKLADDTDTSPDLFRADVSSASATVTRVSSGTGGGGNTDACNPVAGKEGAHWNSTTGAANCGVAAFAGGAGIGSADGTVYFLSPEKLDGSGTADAANLFVARPGNAPHFIATIEATAEAVTNAVYNNEVHRFTDFQVSANGGFAVLASKLPLSGVDTFEHTQVFRYDAVADVLDCVSCASTGAAPTTNVTLSDGLNLADEGTVFFTSGEALVLRDSNRKLDVYEWEQGKQELISTGISQFDSGLLSASADAVNVYFFTRATLVPQDQNGNLMKVYDARAGGGFLAVPPLPSCAAKDECHGPGTQPAPPPQIGTFKGEGGNVKKKKKKKCKKGYVKKNGKCKKKGKKKHKHKKRRSHG